jgi:hypothetical protein
MAAAPPSGPIKPQIVTIPVSGASGIGDLTIPQVVSIPDSGVGAFGKITIPPPTFLEKWGIVFVAVAGGCILAVCACMLWYYVDHLAAPPPQTASVTADAYKTALDLYKTASDQFRDSLSFVFDLMVTRTILPLVTLLLGYLFGSKKS